MHPGPINRGVEIDSEIADGNQSCHSRSGDQRAWPYSKGVTGGDTEDNNENVTPLKLVTTSRTCGPVTSRSPFCIGLVTTVTTVTAWFSYVSREGVYLWFKGVTR